MLMSDVCRSLILLPWFSADVQPSDAIRSTQVWQVRDKPELGAADFQWHQSLNNCSRIRNVQRITGP